MEEFWERVEHWNAKLIPAAIVALLFVIIVEIFFHDFAYHHHTAIAILDYIIIAIFVIDLIFLAIHARTWKSFFKSYWLDIIAVVPLVLIFTILSRVWQVVSAAGKVTVGQAILHESLEIRKGVSALTRGQRIAKYIRIGARSIRVVTKSRLFTKLTHHAHRHKPEYKKKYHKVFERRDDPKKSKGRKKQIKPSRRE